MALLMAVPVTVGFLVPHNRNVSIIVAVVACIIVCFTTWIALMTGWLSRILTGIPIGLAGLFLMAGTADLGPDMALESAGEPVEVVVTDVTRKVERQRGTEGRSREVVTYTYRFTRLDGGPQPDQIIYRGDGGYDGVYEGGRTTLLIDPSGRLENQLASEVDSTTSLSIVIVGMVLLYLAWLPGCLTYARRSARRSGKAATGPHPR